MNPFPFFRVLYVGLMMSGLAAVPVRAATFGHNFLDGGPSSGLSGDYKRGSRFTLTEPGILNFMRAHLDGYGGPQSGYQYVSMVL